MTIHWSVFVPAVLLLLFPADRLLARTVELRSFNCFNTLENSPRFRPWWWVPSLWLDPFRGFLGTLLLQHGCGLGSTDWAAAPKPAYALFVAILVVGVLSQTYTRRSPGVLLAPLGFVAGVVAALLPWPVALLGLATATMGLFAFRQFPAFFACGLAVIPALGFGLGAEAMWTLPACALFPLPILAGFVTGSTLEVPTRDASGTAAREHPPR